MKNDYCIIKVYAATNNEYVVKEGLTFDEAQAEFERLNTIPNTYGETCMYIIGDGIGDLDNISDADILDADEDDLDFNDLERELGSFSFDGSEDE